MAYKLVVFPQAEANIAEAFNYLADRVPEVASRWYRHVKTEIQSLAEMPTRCSVAPESAKLGFELRHLLHGKRPGVYRIIFRILEDRQEVHILAVRHGARKPLTDEDMAPFIELP